VIEKDINSGYCFTIGHSITLALATMQIISVETELIEFLIPLTIFVTACSNLFRKEETIDKQNIQINYFFALFFGQFTEWGFPIICGPYWARAILFYPPYWPLTLALS